MAITNRDGLIAALAGSQRLAFYKASATAEGAGTWHSLWKLAGRPPAGSNPGSANGAVPTSATVGAFSFTNPQSPAISHLMKVYSSSSTIGSLILYDRLWHNSELSGTVTTETAFSAPDLTRPDALGVGTELWGEIYTAIGATASTLTITYVDQDGNTGQYATYSHPANAEAVGQMFPLILAAGDTGVRKATHYRWSTTTGTAGNFGLVLLRRVAELPMTIANVGMLRDYADLGMVRIYDDACLAMMVFCTATNTGNIMGSLNIGQG